MYLKLLAALAAATVFTAPTMAQQITLKVDAGVSIFSDVFNEIVDAFEAEHPEISVELDTSQRDQSDTIQNTLRKAVIGELPDVSFQGFNYLKLLVDDGHVQPLDTFVAADADWATSYSPSVTAAGTIGGHTYGLSLAFSFPIIFYNADLVAEAQGGDKVLPGNWDDILKVAGDIHAAHPDVLGAFTRYNSFMSQGHIMSRGGTLGNEDGSAPAITSPEAMAAFDLYRQFGEAGQAQIDMTDAQVRQAFAAGQVGILADSSSGLESFQQQAEGHFEIATAHLPFEEGASLPTSGLVAVMHTQDAERQAAAWTFMAFMAGPEAQNLIGRRTGYVPANEVAVQSAELLGDYYAEKPAMQASLDSIPYAGPWYVFQGPNAARIDKLFADRLQQVVTLQETPEAAAQGLSEEITALIVE